MGKFKFGNLEGYINYDWDSDNFDLKLSANVMDKKFEICNSQVQGVAQKLIGQHIDNLANGALNFMEKVSPEFRNEKNIVNELGQRAKEVKTFKQLSDVINFAGENQLKYSSGEASYQVHVAIGNYLNEIDQQNEKNTEDIKSNRERINRHEDILKK